MIAPWNGNSASQVAGMLQSRSVFSAGTAPAGGAGCRSTWSGASSERVPLRDAGTPIWSRKRWHSVPTMRNTFVRSFGRKSVDPRCILQFTGVRSSTPAFTKSNARGDGLPKFLLVMQDPLKSDVQALAWGDRRTRINTLNVVEHRLRNLVHGAHRIVGLIRNVEGPEVLQDMAEHEVLCLQVGNCIHLASRAGVDNRTMAEAGAASSRSGGGRIL